jgi:hypothetical protein
MGRLGAAVAVVVRNVGAAPFSRLRSRASRRLIPPLLPSCWRRRSGSLRHGGMSLARPRSGCCCCCCCRRWTAATTVDGGRAGGRNPRTSDTDIPSSSNSNLSRTSRCTEEGGRRSLARRVVVVVVVVDVDVDVVVAAQRFRLRQRQSRAPCTNNKEGGGLGFFMVRAWFLPRGSWLNGGWRSRPRPQSTNPRRWNWK